MNNIKIYYQGKEIEENALCCHCGKVHLWDEQLDEVYQNKFLCFECFDMYYGYCNSCGELNKYCEMSEDIICKGCEK